MSNGHANCIFAVCCPPESEARIEALAEEIAKATGWSAHHDEKSEGNAYTAARWVLATYDLAPKGMLIPLYEEIDRLAREGHVKAEPAFNDPGD